MKLDKYKFSESSRKKLSTCHPDLQIIMEESLRTSPYDFGISEGHRTPEEQLMLFMKGRSKQNGIWQIIDHSKIATNIDGYEKLGKHNKLQSEAVDIKIYLNGKITWEHKYFYRMAGHIIANAYRLLQEKRISRIPNWGGDWKSFFDVPHFEL